ncbi:MAG: ribonuclease P [Candidatus Aenigmarchaeota archaeon]|nr:ribonuclease P [Candidatus Aenigmarchaeota archaeon]
MGKLVKLVLGDVEALFAKAKNAKDAVVAKRFVRKARVLAMKHRFRLPVSFKRLFCKHCNAYFVQGKNVRIRTTKGKVVYTCFTCKKFMRFSYSNKKILE